MDGLKVYQWVLSRKEKEGKKMKKKGWSHCKPLLQEVKDLMESMRKKKEDPFSFLWVRRVCNATSNEVTKWPWKEGWQGKESEVVHLQKDCLTKELKQIIEDDKKGVVRYKLHVKEID